MGMMEMIKSLQAKNKELEEQLEIIEKQRGDVCAPPPHCHLPGHLPHFYY